MHFGTLLRYVLCSSVLGTTVGNALAFETDPSSRSRVVKPDRFPVFTQFSPVPSGKGWKDEDQPLDEQTIRHTVDNLLEHGFSGLEIPRYRTPKERAKILQCAQSRGMLTLSCMGGLELFGRTKPPSVCVYSNKYPQAVTRSVEQALAHLRDVPRLYCVFPYQDEPFHWGPESFGYNAEVKTEFRRRYGYDLPPDLDSVREDPKRWLDVINFRSDYFSDGWRRVYKTIKQVDPSFHVVMTHDSHNTFGAGYGSHAQLAVDDVFHWGGDFADIFVFDIYPYLMCDFRFGEPSRLPKPRISQTHYCFAQMRNLTRAHKKQLGFWVGTYDPAWFKDLGEELAAKHWSEREMSTTAVAQGADFLLTGGKVPIDQRHWESFGQGLQLIQKAGARLLDMPKKKARACMLFPRTQIVQVQQEYFNVGLSYELFLRAFGELDILHEEQVVDDRLDGYSILVLWDVTLLPEDVAKRIVAFVEKGGTVIADCVPSTDTYRRPMRAVEDLFGVCNAETGRIRRTGHWVPRKSRPPSWAYRPTDPPDESVFLTDAIRGSVLGQNLDLLLVSPRPASVTTAEVLAQTAAGQPGVLWRQVGKGHVFLLGFCLQDTYFKTWQDDNATARRQLRGLLRAMTEAAGVPAHVRSSNPDIEASVRTGQREGFLFLINHEALRTETEVELADLGFPISTLIDLETDQHVPFESRSGVVNVRQTVPLGETRILHIRGDSRKNGPPD